MTKNDLETVSEMTFASLNVSSVPIIFKDLSRGYYSPAFILLPEWIFETVDEFQIYYTIHECCHRVVHGHGGDFKRVEARELSQWGLYPVYNREYPNTLRSRNGQTFCGSRGIKKQKNHQRKGECHEKK
jgi:hypothetical protein